MSTETANGTQMTLEEFMPGTFQRQIAGASDFRVRISPLQENNSDFRETVQACFSELCILSDNSKKRINPLTFSLRTLRICLVLMEDGISPDCSLKWNRGGYDAEWQVLNSKDYGVPQNRERCFIVGYLRGRSGTEVFSEQRTNRESSVSIIGHRARYRRSMRTFTQEGITEALDTDQGGGRGLHVALPCFIDLSYQGSKVTEIARCLKARYYKGVENHPGQDSGVAIKVIGKVNSSQDGKVHGIDGIAKCHSAGHNNNPKIAIPVLTPERAEKRQNGRRFKEDGEPMFTLTSNDRHGVAVGIKDVPEQKDRGIYVRISEELTVYAVWYEKYGCYIAIRRLTPRECFRLQGWSDEYFEKAQFVNSDSQLYKQAGNGVTVTVIEAIAEKLKLIEQE